MILSPRLAIEYKVITSPNRPFDDNQIQQNGVDCRVAQIRKISPNGVLDVPGDKPDMHDLQTDPEGYYYLQPLVAYSILCHEYIHMPWHLGGEIIIRSTFNRNGVFGRSSWYDPGFRNFGGLTIYPFVHTRIKIHERIGQLICHHGQPANLYGGDYLDDAVKGNAGPGFKMHDENPLETGE